MSHGWNRAAEAVYGFEDVNALEAAWIAWMRRKESQLPPPPKLEPPPRARPPLIPPVKLADRHLARGERACGRRAGINQGVLLPGCGHCPQSANSTSTAAQRSYQR
jgi:hypothetical protein